MPQNLEVFLSTPEDWWSERRDQIDEASSDSSTRDIELHAYSTKPGKQAKMAQHYKRFLAEKVVNEDGIVSEAFPLLS